MEYQAGKQNRGPRDLKKNTFKFSDFMQLIRQDFKILMTITQLQIRGNRSGRREKRGYREQNSTGDF